MNFALDRLLAESSKRYPNRIAIKDKEKQISYQELEIYSSKISSYILSKDLESKDRVGLYINKSIDGIAAFFGILKADCIFVALDINWPPRRCAYIIDDCQIKLLFSHSKYANRIAEISKLSSSLEEIIFLDKVRLKINTTLLKSPSIVDKDSLAIILYTSGSTGKPKGVMRTHKAEINDFKITQRLYRISKNDCYCLYHPLSVAPGIDDTLLMLYSGGTICVLPEGLSAFPAPLKEFLKNNRITFSRFGPEVIISLVLYGNLKKRDLPDLKKVIISGSRLPVNYLRSFMRLLPDVKVFYEYGITEAIMVSSYTVKKIPSKEEVQIPIGRPPKGIKTYLVDEQGRRLKEKPGVIGELYVSSDSLMSGYWDDPAATKEVLFKDPFSGKERLVYYTHDLVKIDMNRNYIFLGRTDNVVKIRSFRVSLEEIESVLERHPKVKEAACIGIPDEEIGNRLKAVIVKKENAQLDENEVKSFCRQYLATYMVPEVIEFRSFLPITTSRKTDRQTLYRELKNEKKLNYEFIS